MLGAVRGRAILLSESKNSAMRLSIAARVEQRQLVAIIPIPMSYQFLCPQCGRGFLEGTALTDCPDCGVPLSRTAGAVPSDTGTSAPDRLAPTGVEATAFGLAVTSGAKAAEFAIPPASILAALKSNKLPEHLDIDALLRTVLAEQAPNEKIDDALKRVLARDFPAAADPLYKLLCLQLDLYEQAGKTRQQAAEELAHSQSELTATAGDHQIRSTHVTSIQGLEKLPPAMRKMLEK
jgi:hypothetical protein